MTKVLRSVLMLALVMVVLALPAFGGQVARVQITPSLVHWDPQGSYDSLVLTVSKPDGEVVRQEFAAGEGPPLSPPPGGPPRPVGFLAGRGPAPRRGGPPGPGGGGG